MSAISARVGVRTDRARLDECRAEGCVRGQAYCGDFLEYAAKVGDWPDCLHGHVEVVEASRGFMVLAHVSSPNSRVSGASPPTRRSPRLRKRASRAESNCAAS